MIINTEAIQFARDVCVRLNKKYELRATVELPGINDEWGKWAVCRINIEKLMAIDLNEEVVKYNRQASFESQSDEAFQRVATYLARIKWTKLAKGEVSQPTTS